MCILETYVMKRSVTSHVGKKTGLTGTCVYTYIHIHAYIHTYIHTYIQEINRDESRGEKAGLTGTCVYTYIHIHAYMHTYIHTYKRSTVMSHVGKRLA